MLPICLSVTVAETEWKFEPCLACEGSPGPDRLCILSDQALHIQSPAPIMYPQKVPACFDRFRKVDLIYMFSGFFRNLYFHGYFRAKVIKDCPCPYFLYDVIIFFRMECLEAQRVL